MGPGNGSAARISPEVRVIFRVIDPVGIGNACLRGSGEPRRKNRKSAGRALA